MNDIITADGVRLRTRRWTPEAPFTTTVVLVHGFTASKDHPDVVAVAEALVAHGYAVLSYDMRGHHESEGLCTLGDREALDVAAAVDAARQMSERVVTVGASMGGIAVVRHAGSNPLIDGVVTVSAPARWRLPRNVRSVFAAVLTRTGFGRRMASRHLKVRIHPEWSDPPSPLEVAAGIRTPLAVIHGEADRMIPADEAHRLASGSSGPTRLDIVPAMGHAFDALGIPAIIEGIRWVLDHRPPLGDPTPA